MARRGGAAALAKDTKEVKKPMARKIKTIQKVQILILLIGEVLYFGARLS